MYHVALDLSQEQVKQLKVLAATTGTTIQALVTGLVAKEIRNPKTEKSQEKGRKTRKHE